jgi:hypothetical protein
LYPWGFLSLEGLLEVGFGDRDFTVCEKCGYMCRDFFKWMAMQDENQTYWRALGSGQYVWGKGLFQSKAKRCYTLALEAIVHETATPKREWSAKQKWREIFTTNFPN